MSALCPECVRVGNAACIHPESDYYVVKEQLVAAKCEVPDDDPNKDNRRRTGEGRASAAREARRPAGGGRGRCVVKPDAKRQRPRLDREARPKCACCHRRHRAGTACPVRDRESRQPQLAPADYQWIASLLSTAPTGTPKDANDRGTYAAYFRALAAEMSR
mgnify:CR=1 FL=1